MTPSATFVKRVTGSIEDMAMFFVNEPEEKVLAALSQTRENLTAELAETFGAEVAAQFAAKFVETVIGRRRELLVN
jgi:hypothetical protein